jgi:hypothetical protein
VLAPRLVICNQLVFIVITVLAPRLVICNQLVFIVIKTVKRPAELKVKDIFSGKNNFRLGLLYDLEKICQVIWSNNSVKYGCDRYEWTFQL